MKKMYHCKIVASSYHRNKITIIIYFFQLHAYNVFTSLRISQYISRFVTFMYHFMSDFIKKFSFCIIIAYNSHVHTCKWIFYTVLTAYDNKNFVL